MSLGFRRCGLNAEGNGCVIIRYRGRRIHVIVRRHRLCSGWRTFINHANVVSGTILFASYCSVGRVISILQFEDGVGLKSVWDRSVDPFDLPSKLLDEEDILEDLATVTVHTTYFSTYMSMFFAKSSGVCCYEQTSYLSMAHICQHSKWRPHF
ncbi:hypothetical protein Leryth_027040 [Lithospermum erythrorhizon]|nr:hypothetical protein Leryth_027040 [Lithospermum erythrorhizon]